jgi:glucose/arabinose dehydrogenase
VVRVRLDANGKAAADPEQVNRYSSGGGHWTRTIVFGPDNRMYVSIGSTCNLCVEKDSDRAVVMQYDESGKNGRVFARGLRNAVGLAFNPDSKELWAAQNERDNLPPDHENLPPEEINIVHDGGDYGWPYCYGNRIPNPEYHDTARCANTVPPALEMQAHSAPLGIVFLQNATQLPAEYRGDALVTFHGSWNRKAPTGAKVVLVRVQNDKPVSYEDFITGWQRGDGSRWGRPVDVAVLGDGSVLVSDDLSGEIIRIAKK